MAYSILRSQPPRQLFPGVKGHYAHTDQVTIGEVELTAGSIVPTHQHPQEQLCYVISGRIEFTIGTEVRVLEPGACAFIPSDAPHSARALCAAVVLDTFTPPRDDYR